MPFCPQCGVSNPDSARFCDQCGAQLIPVPAKPASTRGSATTMSGTVNPGATSCPQCGAGVIPGEAFCDNCGAPLFRAPTVAASPAPAPDLPFPGAPPQPVYPPPQPATIAAPPRSAVSPPAPTPSVSSPSVRPAYQSLANIRLRLTTGAVLTLPATVQALIGRADPVSNFYPEIDLSAYGGLEQGVGRRHGRFFIQQGAVYYEDLDSTNGSFLNGRKVPPRQPQLVQPGDTLRLGMLSFSIEVH
ncbi:MAG: zinc ribbon domain-containing protein [Chloroflexus sp.]